MKLKIKVRKRKLLISNHPGPFLIPGEVIIGQVIPLPAPTSDSSGQWRYVSSDDKIIRVVGSTATVLDVGSATISAIQAPWGKYTEGNATEIMRVKTTTSAMTIGALIIPDKYLCDAPFTIVKPNSPSSGAFTYTSSNTGVLTVGASTGVCSIVGVGNCIITATQAAAAPWGPAVVTKTVHVLRRFSVASNFAIPDKPVGEVFTLQRPTATGTGGWTYTSSNNSVATVSGTQVTTVGAGSTVITAIQANDSCLAGATIAATLTVFSAMASVGDFVISDKKLCTADFLFPIPNTNSSGAWSFSSSNPSIILVVGGYGRVMGPGQCTITATQNATATHPQTIKTASVNVTAKVASYLSSVVYPPKNIGDPPFTIQPPVDTAPGSLVSPGAWSYASSDTGVMRVTGTTVTIVGTGTCLILATQAPTQCYVGRTVNISMSVGQAAPTLGALTLRTSEVGDPSFTLTAPVSNSQGTWTYTSSDTTVLSISGNTVTVVGPGSCTVTATQAANGNYAAGTVVAPGLVNPSAYTISYAGGKKSESDSDLLNDLKLKYPTANFNAPVRVTVTIPHGSAVWTSSGAYAISDKGLAAGSQLIIVNQGTILGVDPGYAILATGSIKLDNTRGIIINHLGNSTVRGKSIHFVGPNGSLTFVNDNSIRVDVHKDYLNNMSGALTDSIDFARILPDTGLVSLDIGTGVTTDYMVADALLLKYPSIDLVYPVKLTITLADKDTTVRASSAAKYAISAAGLADGSDIRIINRGSIIGTDPGYCIYTANASVSIDMTEDAKVTSMTAPPATRGKVAQLGPFGSVRFRKIISRTPNVLGFLDLAVS